MALGSSLSCRRPRLREVLYAFGVWLGLCGSLSLCRCEPRKQSGEPARASSAPLADATRGAQRSGRSSGEASFLVRTDQGAVLLWSLSGGTPAVVTRATSWLYDDAHQLIWSVHEGQLFVFDLRALDGATTIARGLPLAPRISVTWQAGGPSGFVEQRQACEPGEVVQLEVGEPPSLRVLGEDRTLPITRAGRRWLSAQMARPSRAPRVDGGFGSSSERIELPSSVAACDDDERCGLSAAFGPHGKRLVLVRERWGADCWHRGCLLYDPVTDRFASPPISEDEATGELSAEGGPPRWSSIEAAHVGVCGPYHFDVTQTQLLVRRHLCRLDARCVNLGGETIGWLEPGPTAGEPG